MSGTSLQMSANDMRAHAATKTNAARQLTRFTSRVPKGTPRVLARVWPRTMTATAWLSRPFSAMALAAAMAFSWAAGGASS